MHIVVFCQPLFSGMESLAQFMDKIELSLLLIFGKEERHLLRILAVSQIGGRSGELIENLKFGLERSFRVGTSLEEWVKIR